MKVCSKCREEKSEGEFSLGGRRKLADGTEKRYLNSWCKVCIAARNREYFKAHPEKTFGRREPERSRENSRRYHKEDPGKSNDRCRVWREKNRERYRELVRKWREENRFGRSLYKASADAKERGHEPCNATIEELEAAFTGECHACGRREENCNRKLSMDHCHKSGNFRGWLCHECNTKDVLSEVICDE